MSDAPYHGFTEEPEGQAAGDVGKHQGLARISVGPPNTGKGFQHPLPAVSMTRAPAAHNHFRIQGQEERERYGQRAG